MSCNASIEIPDYFQCDYAAKITEIFILEKKETIEEKLQLVNIRFGLIGIDACFLQRKILIEKIESPLKNWYRF